MTNQDMDFLARKIVSLENKHNALARARQLPNSSVRLIDGSDVSMRDSAESGSDNRTAIEQLEGATTGIGSITDTEAENAISVPEWFNELGVGVDVAWDSTQFATDLALHLETELGEAQLELDQALIDLDIAMTESAEAKADASQAVSDAAEAVSDAAAAITAARDAIVSSQKQWAVSSSATVAPTVGWSNTAPTWTAGQYIWERVVSTKGTGTSTTSSPVVITGNPGAPGDPGEPGSPGATTYTWIKYSNSATGTAPVDDPTGMSYIGIAYNKLTPTESTNPGDYEWSKIKGDPGDQGTSVASVTPYYRLGTSLPAKPTTLTPSGWSTTEPAYVPGSTDNLYVTVRTVLTTNAFTYSDVSLDSAYAAGKAAHALAQTAQTTADGKNKVVRSTGNAASPGSYQLGDSWWKFTGSQIVAMWLHDGTNWVAQTLTDSVITNLNAGTITAGTIHADRIGALSISTEKLAAEAVTTGKLAAESVVAEKIAAGAIAAGHISAGAVVAEAIASGSVTTDKLDALAVTAEKIAAGAIITEKIAAEAITAEHIAANAIDAMTITGAQIYGGYMEAPRIASSAELGSGANALNDPGFASTVNTAWVVSGHTGDAATTQRDTYWWDQTWQQARLYPVGNDTMKNIGNAQVDLILTPAVRLTGSFAFANYSWKPANRSLTNPFTFTNQTDWLNTHLGGAQDPSWAAPNAPAPLAGTARTTYLTNSATVAVSAGDRWNLQLTFVRPAASTVGLASVAVEVVNAATSAVLFTQTLTDEEYVAGRVNTWWDSTFTGNVKYRIKATYTAAGGTVARKPVLGSYAAKYNQTAGTTVTRWDAVASEYVAYKGSISGYQGSINSAPIQARATLNLVAQSAVMAKVEPKAGWQLTPDNGLELFNTLGAQTGRLNGQDNYLSGVFSTADSGKRAQLSSDATIQFLNNLDVVVGGIRGNAAENGVELFGTVDHSTDIPWKQATTVVSSDAARLMNSWVNNINVNWDGLQTRRRLGMVYITGAITKSTAYASLEVVAILPLALRPEVPTMVPAAYATQGGYVLVRTNGEIVTAQSGAGGQIAFAGTLVTT